CVCRLRACDPADYRRRSVARAGAKATAALAHACQWLNASSTDLQGCLDPRPRAYFSSTSATLPCRSLPVPCQVARAAAGVSVEAARRGGRGNPCCRNPFLSRQRWRTQRSGNRICCPTIAPGADACVPGELADSVDKRVLTLQRSRTGVLLLPWPSPLSHWRRSASRARGT